MKKNILIYLKNILLNKTKNNNLKVPSVIWESSAVISILPLDEDDADDDDADDDDAVIARFAMLEWDIHHGRFANSF